MYSVGKSWETFSFIKLMKMVVCKMTKILWDAHM